MSLLMSRLLAEQRIRAHDEVRTSEKNNNNKARVGVGLKTNRKAGRERSGVGPKEKRAKVGHTAAVRQTSGSILFCSPRGNRLNRTAVPDSPRIQEQTPTHWRTTKPQTSSFRIE